MDSVLAGTLRRLAKVPRRAAALLAVLSLSLALAFAPRSGSEEVVLTVECVLRGSVTWSEELRVSPGSLVNVSFIHSVHLTPEHDILVVQEDGFYLEEVWVVSFGAGVPVTPEDVGGGRVERVGDYTVIRGIGRWLGPSLALDLKNAKEMRVKLAGVAYDKDLCDGVLRVSVEG